MLFKEKFLITKKEDGSYNFAIIVSDDTIIIKSVSKSDIEQLYHTLDLMLRD